MTAQRGDIREVNSEAYETAESGWELSCSIRSTLYGTPNRTYPPGENCNVKPTNAQATYGSYSVQQTLYHDNAT